MSNLLVEIIATVNIVVIIVVVIVIITMVTNYNKRLIIQFKIKCEQPPELVD